jgi:Rrf2 family iron-sulfur cluster assembly transcriptional regulator
MKIDTKGRVALAAILDIAIHGTSRPVRLADISTRQRVSQSYLEQLFKMLLHSGLVVSVRGPGGGYRLNRRLAVVSVSDVIDAVDTEARGEGRYRAKAYSSEDMSGITGELWSGLDDYLRDYLSSVTLDSVVASAAEVADRRERAAVVVTVPYVERPSPRHEERPAATIA